MTIFSQNFFRDSKNDFFQKTKKTFLDIAESDIDSKFQGCRVKSAAWRAFPEQKRPKKGQKRPKTTQKIIGAKNVKKPFLQFRNEAYIPNFKSIQQQRAEI